jgi:hypothetical protein
LYLLLKLNEDAMKKFTLLFACFSLLLLARCTEDETIEEQIYARDTIIAKAAFSGEEGDQDLINKKRD